MPVILFDLDGTFIDAKIPILESVEYAFQKRGLPVPDPDRSASLIGHPLREIFRVLGGDEEDMHSMVEYYREHFLKVGPEKTRLVSGARESLEMAASLGKAGVVTTRVSHYSQILLNGLLGDRADLFSTIVGFDHVQNPKPHPEPVYLALERLRGKRSGENAWFIGDTPMDMEAALAAGVRPVGVRSGHGDLSRYESDPAIDLVDDLAGALQIIHRSLES